MKLYGPRLIEKCCCTTGRRVVSCCVYVRCAVTLLGKLPPRRRVPSSPLAGTVVECCPLPPSLSLQFRSRHRQAYALMCGGVRVCPFVRDVRVHVHMCADFTDA